VGVLMRETNEVFFGLTSFCGIFFFFSFWREEEFDEKRERKKQVLYFLFLFFLKNIFRLYYDIYIQKRRLRLKLFFF